MSHSARRAAPRRSALAACLALAFAAVMACFVTAPAMAAPATDQPPQEAPAEQPSAIEKPALAEKPSEPAAEPPKPPAAKTEKTDKGEKGQKGEKPVPAMRKLTEEEIRELPILKRYDMPKEKLEALLGDVKDHTFGYDEPAFYALMAFVARQDPELMKPKPDDEDTDYSQLLAMPSSYRGHPVTIRGSYMLVTPWHVPVAALGKDVPRLFTVTLRELPLDRSLPVATVVVAEDPMPYLTVEDEVRVKGYFYKIRDYQGTRGPGQAPMIIAQRLEPVGADTTGYIQGGRYTAGWSRLVMDPQFDIMVVAVLAMIIIFVYLRYRFRPFRKTHGKGKYPYPVHRFRLRRDNRHGPFDPTGPGGTESSPKPQGGADH